MPLVIARISWNRVHQAAKSASKGDFRLVLKSRGGQRASFLRGEDAGRHVQQPALAGPWFSEDHQRGALLCRLGGQARDSGMILNGATPEQVTIMRDTIPHDLRG